MERIITWDEIIDRVKKLDQTKKYYGVPRGGSYISAMLNPVMTPEEADIIIDDLIDSGATRDKYKKYNKPFIGVFDKQKEHLGWLVFPWEKSGDIEIEENVARIIEYFDDINREGLKDTPKRYIKFLKEFLNPEPFNMTVFENEGLSDMVIQKNIPFYSLCEHHLAPFFGTASIAYIPNKNIVGLSKLARVLDMFARNFQNQERITQQVGDYLMDKLNPYGVAVSITAQHLCMSMRGIKKHDTNTQTFTFKGAFNKDNQLRQEFLNLL